MHVERNVLFCIEVLVIIKYIHTARICSPSKLLVRGERFNALELFIPEDKPGLRKHYKIMRRVIDMQDYNRKLFILGRCMLKMANSRNRKLNKYLVNRPYTL